MATNFKLKRSSVASKRPTTTNLELGELALNTYDGYLFTERQGLGISTVANLTPWYENTGAGSIFYINKVGIGTTAVPDTNQLLVKGGTETDRLNVTGISTYGGNVDINANIDVSGTSTFGGLVDINAGGQANSFKVEDLTAGRVVLAGTGGELEDSNNLRFDGNNLIVTGTTDTDNFINTGISTFVGIITASATQNVIPFLFNAWSDIPSASAYHGAFIHVHARGKGYFAHAANWYEIVNKELDGTIGVGTELVNVGITTVTDFNATGNVTLGNANTDNIVFTGEINSDVIPNTNIAYDLGSSTKRWGNLHINKITAGGGGVVIDDDITTRNLRVTGLSTFTGNIDANGNLDVDGDTTLDATTVDGLLDINAGGQANSFKVEDLTAGRVVLAGTGGELEDSANLTFNGSNLTVGGNVIAVDGTFSGNVSVAGTLTYQDVTNVDSVGIATARVGLKVLDGGIDAVGVITATGGLDAVGIQSGGVNITTGIITAINFTGTGNTVTYNSSTKVVSVSVGGAGGGSGGKFVENNTGIHTLSNVGIGTTNASDKLKVLGDVAFTGALKVTDLALSGSNGNYLKSVGTGVTWASFPTARTVGLQTATNNQTSFTFAYNVGFLDVYINGVKLTANEFTATNGTSVVLTDGAFTGDQVQLISFNTTATGGGGGGSGITDVVQDATPQLGGNLDLNSKVINGSGNIDYTGNFKASGIATATTFVGALTGNASSATILQTARTIGGVSFNGSANINLPGVNASGNQDTSGTAAVATNVTVSANNSTNETVYPIFVDGATGSQGAETDTGLNYNPNTGRLTAVSYAGDGSALTGISGSQNLFSTIAVSGQSNVVADSATDTLTLVAGSNMTITTNAGTDTVTFASSGGGGNTGFSTAGGSFTVNAGVTTVINTFNINTNTKLSEYTLHLENVNGNIQSQKVLVMNYGAGIGLTAYSSEYGIMFHPNQIADIGVVVTAGICSLTATTKSGITGITTFSLTRQDQS
tara:strand:- start:517 stop:3498 length:2982 start_codon:yes stop_codon:yes gene_type:complete